jgi:hypothetical protein
LFALVFVFAVLTQFGVTWYQRRSGIRAELRDWAQEIMATAD